jgi:hypothetical protein
MKGVVMSGVLEDIDRRADLIKAKAEQKKQQEAIQKAQKEAERLRHQRR